MIFEIVKRWFWAMRFIFISFCVTVWGMTIDNWYISNFIGMFGIFIFLGGILVLEMEVD